MQAEVAWLIKSVNPEVPLGEAALGLILEEVRRAGGGGAARRHQQLASAGLPSKLGMLHALPFPAPPADLGGVPSKG